MVFQNAGPVVATAPSSANLGLPIVSHGRSVDGALGCPSGFPDHLYHPLAWTGNQLSQGDQLIHHLSQADLAEIKSALMTFKEQELDGDLVDRQNFPLPKLAQKLDAVGEILHNGIGVAVIRGLDPKEFSVEDLTIVRLGLQIYIADQQGRQDHKGNMLVHIIADNSSEIKLGHHRHSTTAISFHNEEAGDIVSWLTRSTAASGGRCIIASAYEIYNVLATHRPDILRTLAKSDWPLALPRFQCRPLIFYEDSRLIMNFGRTPLMGNATHPRPEHLPKLNDRQREALDTVEVIAKAVQLEIQTQAGDIHFINNLAILHRREGFVNGASLDEKRHLVRMRLRSSRQGWSIPGPLQREWREAFNSKACKTWHLDPMPGEAFPLRKYTN
ncbi:TfdA family taurine catabolism dioxygenase TauD [Microdochium bolleyi]|uniref:TfdA family taurine catabolism dioxygenase TauD n=1 Tax=Microdochium bolleyi TaxID=196109 RepID=A0A136JEC0_9PEZI|nr:TfdA family taurine catabolism dioxygenase TauD [Microdochium bolleyi]